MQIEGLKDSRVSVLSHFMNPYEYQGIYLLTNFAEVSELVAFIFFFFLFLSFFSPPGRCKWGE